MNWLNALYTLGCVAALVTWVGLSCVISIWVSDKYHWLLGAIILVTLAFGVPMALVVGLTTPLIEETP